MGHPPEVAVEVASHLLHLSDDALTLTLTRLDERDITACAQVCRRLRCVCGAETLWCTVVHRRWPLLPRSLLPREQNVQWRELAVRRAQLPHWRELAGLMDEVETLCDGPDLADEASDWGDRLATLLVAIFGKDGEVGRASEPGREWARRLSSALFASPAILAALAKWGATLAAPLDRFYDFPAAQEEAELRQGLLRALRGASALQLLLDETVSPHAAWRRSSATAVPSAVEDDGVSSLEAWKHVGLTGVVEEVESSVASLEMEGFFVGVPPRLRPAMPHSHAWWHARPPLHAHGRLHYC